MASISSENRPRGQVGAEDEKDRRAGEDGQLGPDGQQALGAAQQRAGAGIGAGPGDVAVQVDRQAVAERGTVPGKRARRPPPATGRGARTSRPAG